jgi:hypothetical protein
MKFALAVFLALATAPETGAKSDLHCVTGPVEKTYGGSKWLVHSCTDGKSLVFTAASGPAVPFEFDLTYTGKGYDLDGRGKGDRKATDAAYADLQTLRGKDILALIKETQKAERKH